MGVVRDTVVNNIGEEPQPRYLPMAHGITAASTMQVRTVGPPGEVVPACGEQGAMRSIQTWR